MASKRSLVSELDYPTNPDAKAKEGRPVVLQVIPRLISGGVERGAVDIAAAVVSSGGTALVASEGGPMEYELRRVGAIHLKLPLASKNPLVMYRNVGRLVSLIQAHDVDIVHARSRAPAWSAAAAARLAGLLSCSNFARCMMRSTLRPTLATLRS